MPRKQQTTPVKAETGNAGHRRREVVVCFLLFLAVVAIYSQVRTHAFLNFDDPDYVLENRHVREGLTVHSLEWAFSSTQAANWFPLTWISHMLDYRLFGLESGWHHLTSVLLHALSTLLLFGVLQRMTGSLWRSAFVAAIFAVHPLHIESVAWIAERKDVLSGLFWFLTMWAYAGYAARPSKLRYLWVVLAFTAGLMSKPMIVTFPLVALLLDYWPLRRSEPWSRRIVEKLPLLALSVVCSAVTYFAQERGGAVLSFDQVGAGFRIGNALLSYLIYLGQSLWPAGLSVFYPYRIFPVWEAAAAALVLGAITAAIVRERHRRPYLAVGWLWYLVTLLPVIGLIQVGAQSHADRYTYIPLIGIAILLAWGFTDYWESRGFGRRGITAVALVACGGYSVVTASDLGYWTDSEALFRHAIAASPGNYVAFNSLGAALSHEGRVEQAVVDFDEALRIRPAYPSAQSNLGQALILEGKPADAVPHLREAIRLQPDYADAHVNLGTALVQLGREAEAAAEYREALRFAPDNAEAHCGLGVILNDAGQSQEALDHLREAVQLKPEYVDGHYNLGRILGVQGRTAEAIVELAETIRLKPDDAAAHFNLGTAYVSREQFSAAVNEFAAAVRLQPGYLSARFNLASALAATGRRDDAIQQFEEVLREKPDSAEARQSLEALQAR